jgi:hypothetical protein
MSEKQVEESGQEQITTLTKAEEKKLLHTERIQRTLVACFMGLLVGVLSFFFAGAINPDGTQATSIIGWLLLLAGVVFQKHIFIILKIDSSKLGAKDWFYQAFMTFALWFIAWTLLLTSSPI